MSSSRLPLYLAGLLAVGQVGVGALAWSRARTAHTTYVFTPMTDVVPGGAPLSAGEAQALAVDVRHQLDARDMQTAYARMGATMSLNDLLRGVEVLEQEGKLAPEQRVRLDAILTAARADHQAAVDVQREILDLEAKIGGSTGQILAGLPPEVRARVEARLAAGKRK